MGDDFRSMFAYSFFLAWFGSGYVYTRQSRWSLDRISTSPVYLAVYCPVYAQPEEHKKSGFTGKLLQENVFVFYLRYAWLQWMHFMRQSTDLFEVLHPLST